MSRDMSEEVMSACREALDARLSAAATLRIRSALAEALREEAEGASGPILTMEEVSRYLRVDPATVEAHLNEIPCFELGGRIRFRREAVDEWIRKRERKFAMETLESEMHSELEPQPALRLTGGRIGGRLWLT